MNDKKTNSTEERQNPQLQTVIADESELVIQRLLEEQKDVKLEADSANVDWEEHKSMFEIPESCKKQLHRYAFVFCPATDRMLRKYQQLGFIIANKTRCPWIPTSEFSSAGVVERRGYQRHVLLFMTREKREALAKREQSLYERQKEALDKSGDPRFYKSGEGDKPIGHERVYKVTDLTGSEEALNIPPGEPGSSVDFAED